MMYVINHLVALLVVGTLQHGTHSCSPPMNYESLSPRAVIYNMDLVLLGTFISQTNKTVDWEGYTRYLLTLDVEVHCVLKNANDVPIDRNVKITEVRMSSWKMDGGLCVNNFYDIRFGIPKTIISVRPHSVQNLTGEFEFSGYNLQGPYFYTNPTLIADVMANCGFQTPKALPGGSCPLRLSQNAECWKTASAGARVNNPMNVVVATAFLLLVSIMLT